MSLPSRCLQAAVHVKADKKRLRLTGELSRSAHEDIFRITSRPVLSCRQVKKNISSTGILGRFRGWGSGYRGNSSTRRQLSNCRLGVTTEGRITKRCHGCITSARGSPNNNPIHIVRHMGEHALLKPHWKSARPSFRRYIMTHEAWALRCRLHAKSIRSRYSGQSSRSSYHERNLRRRMRGSLLVALHNAQHFLQSKRESSHCCWRSLVTSCYRAHLVRVSGWKVGARFEDLPNAQT